MYVKLWEFAISSSQNSLVFKYIIMHLSDVSDFHWRKMRSIKRRAFKRETWKMIG